MNFRWKNFCVKMFRNLYLNFCKRVSKIRDFLPSAQLQKLTVSGRRFNKNGISRVGTMNKEQFLLPCFSMFPSIDVMYVMELFSDSSIFVICLLPKYVNV